MSSRLITTAGIPKVFANDKDHSISGKDSVFNSKSSLALGLPSRLPKPAAGIKSLDVNLSVIILSYNHPEITARTLSSVSRFSFADVILIHNGSEQKHIEDLQFAFPDVTHYIIAKNQGFSGGANEGLKQGFLKNEWCLFLTNDCQLERLGTLPTEPTFIAPKILSRKTENIDSIGGFFEPRKAQIMHCKDATTFYHSDLKKYVPGTAFLMHRTVFQNTKGFDTSLFTYWEDVDLSQRVQQFGYPIKIDENWQIRHAIGKTCHKNPLYTLYYYQRNRMRVSKRYCSSFEMVILYMYFFRDIFKLSFRLLLKKRFHDLKFIRAAIKDI